MSKTEALLDAAETGTHGAKADVPVPTTPLTRDLAHAPQPLSPSSSLFPLSFFLIPHSSLRSVTLGVALGGNQAFSFHSWHQIRPTRTTQGCNTWCKRGYNALSFLREHTHFQFNSDFVGRRRSGLGRACAPDRMAYSYTNPCVWALQCPRWWVLAEVSAIRHTKGPFWLIMGVNVF